MISLPHVTVRLSAGVMNDKEVYQIKAVFVLPIHVGLSVHFVSALKHLRANASFQLYSFISLVINLSIQS